MVCFRLRGAVECEDRIPGSYHPWGRDALLVRVKNGLGTLSMRYGVDENGDSYNFLLLDHLPLITSYGEEQYCPTCAKLLSRGLGREHVNPSLIDTLKASQEPTSDIAETFETIKPVLTILDDGYYLLTRIEMIPTDGEGGFFWNLTSSRRPYKATADVFYKSFYCSGTPNFLLPSQSIRQLNRERVDHYLEQISAGKTMTGLAYYYDGFMSTLLDGHHRATAAYLADKTIDCLTLIEVTGICWNADQKPVYFNAGGVNYPFHLLKRPKRVYHNLKKIIETSKSKLEVREVENILKDCQRVWMAEAEEEHPFSQNGRRTYPESIAFSNKVTDTSEGHIADLLNRRDEEAEFEVELIFKKLQQEESERAFQLAKSLFHDTNWRGLLEEVMRYFASLDSTEVEDLFIHYLIHTEYDSKDPYRKLADDYLNKR
ncbi:hypothetical protein [Gorillibacterium sp. sgz500922]|uniref:hypothetical protein n=1 Tax=Gorillibacterium sp. sgz500922 TaxID=3446694 RepID=UPI003F677617